MNKKKNLITGIIIYSAYKYLNISNKYEYGSTDEENKLLSNQDKKRRSIKKEEKKRKISKKTNNLNLSDFELLLDDIIITDSKNWNELGNKNGTTSYLLSNSDNLENNIITLKSVSVSDSSFDKIYNFLIDPINLYKYNKKIRNINIIERNDDYNKFTFDYMTPFPLKTRGIFIESNGYKDEDVAVIMSKDCDNYQNEKKKIRMEVKFSCYFLKKLGINKTLIINLYSFNFNSNISNNIIINKFIDSAYKLCNHLDSNSNLKE